MKWLNWNALKLECSQCEKCDLAKTRNNIVFGEGNPNSLLMFVGEGPGADEDATGRPFVGRAGKLFDKAIGGIGLDRKEIYIGNIVKCRPPKNRVPTTEEARTCIEYLRNQVVLIKPKIIVCLGATAMKYIVGSQYSISKIRGQWIERNGYWLISTFHPAALLRDESKKIPFWQDLKMIKKKYDEFLTVSE